MKLAPKNQGKIEIFSTCPVVRSFIHSFALFLLWASRFFSPASLLLFSILSKLKIFGEFLISFPLIPNFDWRYKIRANSQQTSCEKFSLCQKKLSNFNWTFDFDPIHLWELLARERKKLFHAFHWFEKFYFYLIFVESRWGLHYLRRDWLKHCSLGPQRDDLIMKGNCNSIKSSFL